MTWKKDLNAPWLTAGESDESPESQPRKAEGIEFTLKKKKKTMSKLHILKKRVEFCVDLV